MPFGPRQLLEHRVAEISTELEVLFDGARDQARREQAEQLNQAVRRLRIAPDAAELCATLADAAARLASGAILFRVAEGTASSDRIDVPLGDAPALAAAAESQDPLIAAATPGEVSAPLVELLAHAPDTRVSIFPVVHGVRVAALLYCWGSMQVAALELLAQMASAVWSAIPVPPPQLVSIAQAASRVAGTPAGRTADPSAGAAFCARAGGGNAPVSRRCGAGGPYPAQSLRSPPPAHRRCAAGLSLSVLRGLREHGGLLAPGAYTNLSQ